MTHAHFLWLAYGLTALLMVAEPVLAWRRLRAARQSLAEPGASR